MNFGQPEERKVKSDEELIEECEEREWEIEFYHLAVGCLVSWKQVLLVYLEDGLASARKKLRKSKQKSKKQLKGHHYSLG